MGVPPRKETVDCIPFRWIRKAKAPSFNEGSMQNLGVMLKLAGIYNRNSDRAKLREVSISCLAFAWLFVQPISEMSMIVSFFIRDVFIWSEFSVSLAFLVSVT